MASVRSSAAAARRLARRLLVTRREPHYQAARIAGDRRAGRTSVLILTMGKVGSQTVKRTLADVDGVRAHTLHFLSAAGIAAESARAGVPPTALAFPAHLNRSRAWREARDRQRLPDDLRLVTIVRDPVGRQVSDLFYNAPRIAPWLLDASGAVDLGLARTVLQQWVEEFDEDTAEVTTYLDRELRGELGVDVMAHDFDTATGATVVPGQPFPTLVLRMEDLDAAMRHALPSFLDVAGPLEPVHTNRARDKDYAARYRQLRSDLGLDRDAVRRIYDTTFARHFWDEAQRQAMVDRWVG